MAWHARVLVIANLTADSPELLAALRARIEQGSIEATLLMPATRIGLRGREEAQVRLDEALEGWREAGIEAAGIVGDPDPVVAVHEAWNPRAFDEVIVSTLPGHSSKWLQFDLPHRVAQITGLEVTHVAARKRPQLRFSTPPQREKLEFGPLTLRSPRHR
jgi:hypothetical protein